MKIYCLIFYVISQPTVLVLSQAPGDGDNFCTELSVSITPPVYPSNFKILMDSYNYVNLIPVLSPQVGVWQQVDVDFITNTTGNDPSYRWVQSTSSACRQSMSSCYIDQPHPQNNWLITQHISRLVNGSLLPQVSVLVEFQLEGCDSGCQRSFLVEVWETSNINREAARNTSQYRRVRRVAPNSDSGLMSQNASIQVDFNTNESGFYLAFVDDNTCIAITHVIVFYYVCPGMVEDLVIYPETLSPPINVITQSTSVVGQCVEEAEGELSGNNPLLQCLQVGRWDTLQEGTGCQCRDGFQEVNNNESCVRICPAGEYLSLTNSSCQPCPDNTRFDSLDGASCPCLDGYYRAPEENGDFPCRSLLETTSEVSEETTSKMSDATTLQEFQESTSQVSQATSLVFQESTLSIISVVLCSLVVQIR